MLVMLTSLNFSIFYWVSERNKKMRPTAPTYIEMVMSWTEKQIKDENVFPTKYGEC